MKVGILTFHRVPNVGAYLQCASLCRVVRSLGHDVEVIDYAPRAQLELCHPAVRRRLAGICRNPRHAVGRLRSLWETVAHFRAAQQDIARLPLGSRVTTPNALAQLKYDRIILGSDEVWNAHNPLMDCDLSYAGIHFRNQGLCAYAPSFGSVENPSDLPPGMEQALGRIEHLSARDQNSVNLLSRCGLKSTLVVDPTLLNGRVATNGMTIGTGNRIVIYGAALPAEFLDALHDLAVRKHLNLLSVIYPQQVRIPHQSAVPSDRFLNLFGHAKAIVTTTFHGAIFAILAGKPFAVVSPGQKINKIAGLLHLVGAEDRLVKEANRLEEMLAAPLNAAAVNGRISQASMKSMEFLQNALA